AVRELDLGAEAESDVPIHRVDFAFLPGVLAPHADDLTGGEREGLHDVGVVLDAGEISAEIEIGETVAGDGESRVVGRSAIGAVAGGIAVLEGNAVAMPVDEVVVGAGGGAAGRLIALAEKQVAVAGAAGIRRGRIPVGRGAPVVAGDAFPAGAVDCVRV